MSRGQYLAIYPPSPVGLLVLNLNINFTRYLKVVPIDDRVQEHFMDNVYCDLPTKFSSKFYCVQKSYSTSSISTIINLGAFHDDMCHPVYET